MLSPNLTIRSASQAPTHPNSPDGTELSLSPTMELKRWDGDEIKCVATKWNSLPKDPEFSTGNGNCLIYLHKFNEGGKQGRDPKAPAFRLPFSLLLATKCYPMIEAFHVVRSTDAGSRPPRTLDEIKKWYGANPERTVELFIRPPLSTDRGTLWRHELSLRNFFAWVLKRPLVGETLGGALVGLLHSMHEYRSGEVVDNVADLVEYLGQKGYLRLSGHPNHALAVLRLAETFRLKDLYLHALTHCVAMRDLLPSRLEFQYVSLATRKLIHDASFEAGQRFQRASHMLANFLDQELSETHLGIPAGLRAHLERFRSFILSFYSTKLGYYPPRPFDGIIYRTMARDFEALYKLLVDESYTSSEPMPSTAVGGICTLQLIQTFDTNNGFEGMRHPLPKLPDESQQARSRRTSWLPPNSKQRIDERQLSHVALVNATNWDEKSFQNGLVRAYRKFEQDCTTTLSKIDSHENLSLVDGRKVRWILIYAVRQTLRHVMQRPAEVPDDPKAVYVVSIARNTRVPWQDGRTMAGLPRVRTEPNLSRLQERIESVEAPGVAEKVEIEPDTDYIALTQGKGSPSPEQRVRWSCEPATSSNTHAALTRTNSLRQMLTRSATLRMSMRRLKGALQNSGSPKSPTRDTAAQSDDGDKCGIDAAKEATLARPSPDPSSSLMDRSRSTASESDTGRSSTNTVPSTSSMIDSLGSSLWSAKSSESLAESPKRLHKRNTVVYVNGPQSPFSSPESKPSRRRPMSTAFEGYRYAAAKALGQIVDQERREAGPRQEQSSAQSPPLPQYTHDDDGLSGSRCLMTRDSGDWTAMQEFLDGKDPKQAGSGTDYAWEQYADLGGLTDVR